MMFFWLVFDDVCVVDEDVEGFVDGCYDFCCGLIGGLIGEEVDGFFVVVDGGY